MARDGVPLFSVVDKRQGKALGGGKTMSGCGLGRSNT